MKSLYVASLYVLIIACGLCWAVEEMCSRFRFRQVKYTFDAQKITYHVGIIKHDGNIFNLRIKHPEITVSSIAFESPQASLTTMDGDLYTFVLNDIGKKQLQKKRQICKYALIAIDIKFPPTVQPNPQRIELINGNFSCVARKFPAPTYEVCKQLPNVAGNCRIDKTFLGNYQNGQGGYFDLNVTRLSYHKLTIGLSSPVKKFIIFGSKIAKSECNTIFHLHRRGSRKHKGRVVRLWYFIRVDAGAPIPEIQYISYGNRMCNTMCGIKPVCPTTPPPKPATEVTATTKPTTGSIELDSNDVFEDESGEVLWAYV